jgi:hypothetical protein
VAALTDAAFAPSAGRVAYQELAAASAAAERLSAALRVVLSATGPSPEARLIIFCQPTAEAFGSFWPQCCRLLALAGHPPAAHRSSHSRFHRWLGPVSARGVLRDGSAAVRWAVCGYSSSPP